MAIVTEDGGFIPERYEFELDNRDTNTTWLRIEGAHGDYVEVSPYELVENMIENCSEVITAHTDVTDEALRAALETLKRASGIRDIEHPDDMHQNRFNPYWNQED